jgi:hypothetical protein
VERNGKGNYADGRGQPCHHRDEIPHFLRGSIAGKETCMAKGVKMTEAKFKAIKILLAGGATYKETAESMGVSTVVVGYCKHSETFEEYRQKIYVTSGGYRRKLAAEKKAQEEKEAQETAEQKKAEPETPVAEQNVVEHRQTVTIQATHYMMEEMKKTNELLKLISSKLAFIVDELTK